MKARHRGSAEALRLVIDDLQASLVEAPDSEILEQTLGCWVPGAEAERARRVLREALLSNPKQSSWPGSTRPSLALRAPARVKPGHDEER